MTTGAPPQDTATPAARAPAHSRRLPVYLLLSCRHGLQRVVPPSLYERPRIHVSDYNTTRTYPHLLQLQVHVTPLRTYIRHKYNMYTYLHRGCPLPLTGRPRRVRLWPRLGALPWRAAAACPTACGLPPPPAKPLVASTAPRTPQATSVVSPCCPRLLVLHFFGVRQWICSSD